MGHSSIQGELNTAGALHLNAESAMAHAVHMGNPESVDDKIAAIRELRIMLNLTISSARTIADVLIQRGKGGRELSLCITNLQQARSWAREALGELGHEE